MKINTRKQANADDGYRIASMISDSEILDLTYLISEPISATARY